MSMAANVPDTIMEVQSDGVAIGAATDDALLMSTAKLEDHRECWIRIIDDKLIEWGRDPLKVEDIDLIPPSHEAITRAISIVKSAIQRNWPAPLSVVPDGDGGIVLERWSGPHSEAIEIGSDGSAEYVRCSHQRVVERRETSLGL